MTIKKFFVCAGVMGCLSLNPAMAEWTGDARDGMFSGVVIDQFHTGQIDNNPYFCIEGKQPGGSSIRACSMKNSSVWGPSFSTLYNQALYFYTTCQLVRIYYEPGVWTYPPFVKALTSNALVGLSTCATSTECFGPDRKKN
ncbi:TPA: subtilase AB5 cytotoxin subunit B [Escherichia coli]